MARRDDLNFVSFAKRTTTTTIQDPFAEESDTPPVNSRPRDAWQRPWTNTPRASAADCEIVC